MSAASLVSTFSRSRARSVQVSRAGRGWPAASCDSPRPKRAAVRSAPLGYSFEIGLEVGDGPAGVAGRPGWRWAMAQRSEARSVVALGQAAGLDEQGVGPFGIGRDGRQVGLEEAVGEAAVDLGEPVLAVVGQERFGLGAGERLGGGELAARRPRRPPARTGASAPRGPFGASFSAAARTSRAASSLFPSRRAAPRITA